MSQKNIFLASEGDSYYRRNREKLSAADGSVAADRVLASLRTLSIRTHSILEVGCSNGWRLEALRREYDAQCYGIDPSSEAVADGAELFPHVSLQTGTADELPFNGNTFDLVIFGFCLYLCDRQDLFRIASEADRVLMNKGHLAILDFHPPFAYRNKYKHDPGVYAYKMNYARLFQWNPAYTVLLQSVGAHQDGMDADSPEERVSVTVLRKDIEHAYPDNPYPVTTQGC